MSYIGKEKDFWTRRHELYASNLLAVGRVTASASVNKKEYELARRQFDSMVLEDFRSDRSAMSVVDFGFGQGHYAVACSELGFGSYLGYDFASPLPATGNLGGGYVFERGDVSDMGPPKMRFDLVLCIDTIFHVVDDEKFSAAIRTLSEHVRPGGMVYITSLFEEKSIATHVRHRSLKAFQPLQLVGGLASWRDNKIGRFRFFRDEDGKTS